MFLCESPVENIPYILASHESFNGSFRMFTQQPNSQQSVFDEVSSPLTMRGSSRWAALSYIFQLKQIVEGLLKQEIWDDSTFTAAV